MHAYEYACIYKHNACITQTKMLSDNLGHHVLLVHSGYPYFFYSHKKFEFLVKVKIIWSFTTSLKQVEIQLNCAQCVIFLKTTISALHCQHAIWSCECLLRVKSGCVQLDYSQSVHRFQP